MKNSSLHIFSVFCSSLRLNFGRFIILVVCRLYVYVGKERMLVFPVVISVAMTQKAVAMVVRGNQDPK